MRAIPGTITAHPGVEPDGHDKHAGKKYPTTMALATQVALLEVTVAKLVHAVTDLTAVASSLAEPAQVA